MIIEICGQKTAVSLVADARERTFVISITSTEDEGVAFPPNENVASILRLCFNDLTEPYDEDGFPYGRPLPEQGDFEGLKTFVDALDGERLIVHCWEGASRSAAVATAIFEARGGVDRLKTHGRYAPNPRVYALACRELGIPLRGLNYTAVPNDAGSWTMMKGERTFT
ncbi:MAG: hypothetical protein IJ240_09205 [Clostridia bacterium]|nr:hypothetical protein [Clostridia bacterium]